MDVVEKYPLTLCDKNNIQNTVIVPTCCAYKFLYQHKRKLLQNKVLTSASSFLTAAIISLNSFSVSPPNRLWTVN